MTISLDARPGEPQPDRAGQTASSAGWVAPPAGVLGPANSIGGRFSESADAAPAGADGADLGDAVAYLVVRGRRPHRSAIRRVLLLRLIFVLILFSSSLSPCANVVDRSRILRVLVAMVSRVPMRRQRAATIVRRAAGAGELVLGKFVGRRCT